MHPEYHRGRREKRTQDIQRKYGKCRDAVFVNAARYARRRGFAAAVIDNANTCKNSVTVRTEHVETAEELAIALAVAITTAEVVISDSQKAVHNFANGRVSPEALRILLAGKIESRDVYILWPPAHSTSLAGNEVAHGAARGLTDRAATINTAAASTATSGEEWEWEDRLATLKDITQHYTLARCKFPQSHQKLNNNQAVTWRQLQPRTFPSPVILNLCYPDLYSSSCKFCEARATLEHMLWECQRGGAPDGDAASNRTRWETTLLSHALEDQLWAVQRAEAAARAQGLVADT
uniref:Tick transposon n=1 Tax=Rhipicephalus pulchellus TaxID=72859 RepID=L7M3S6_RHIPC